MKNLITKMLISIIVTIAVCSAWGGMAYGLTIDVEHFESSNSPRGVALSPDGSQLYVAHWSGDPIYVYSTEDYSLLGEIYVGGLQGGVVVSNDGRYVYATNYYGGYVSRYDTLEINPEIKIDQLGWAEQVRKTPEGDKLIVNFNSRSGLPGSIHSLALIDISGGNFNLINTLSAGRPLDREISAFTEGSTHMYIGGFSNMTEGPTLLKVSLDNPFEIVGITPLTDDGATENRRTAGVVRAGGRLYVGDNYNKKIHVVDEESFVKIHDILLPYSPLNIALHPDRHHLFILYDGILSVMDLPTENIVYSLPGLNPNLNDIEFSVDGTKAYVSHGGGDGGVSFLTIKSLRPEPTVEMVIDKMEIDLEGGKFEIKGYLDTTDFENLVLDPQSRLLLELQTGGNEDIPEFDIVGEDQIQLTTDDDWEELKYESED